MKALFFLRHYNDIDHITPIIAKWVECGHSCDVVLIGASRFRKDFRIDYLSKLPGTRVNHIREIFSAWLFLKWRLQMLLLTGNLRRLFIGSFIAYLARLYDADRRLPLWKETTNNLLSRCFDQTKQGIVAFDWIERNSVIAVEWVETVIGMARARGLGTVSLPHGDSPHANQLIRRGEWKVGPDLVFSTARIFDRLAVPNELCAKRLSHFYRNKRLQSWVLRVIVRNGLTN